jgi:hypothetical protein
MPTLPRPNLKQMEVIVMFEPHRLQHDLLQTAYASLVPPSRRRLPKSPASAMASQGHLCDLHGERHVP